MQLYIILGQHKQTPTYLLFYSILFYLMTCMIIGDNPCCLCCFLSVYPNWRLWSYNQTIFSKETKVELKKSSLRAIQSQVNYSTNYPLVRANQMSCYMEWHFSNKDKISWTIRAYLLIAIQITRKGYRADWIGLF